MKEIKVVLKRGREKPVLGGHPWIFSGAIDLIDEDFELGDIARIHSESGAFLGKGYLNPKSEIAIRVLTRDDQPIDKSFFSNLILEAGELRKKFIPPRTNAYRLVNSEGDFLPGLIVDRYADYLVLQILTAGMEGFKDWIVEILGETFKPRGIYEKDNSEVRHLEGLRDHCSTLRGAEPPDYVEVEEYGVRFMVDIRGGQKTGFFLDQRENRQRIRNLAPGKWFLNAFSYSGGFSVYAALSGAAHVTSVETSEKALNTSRRNFELNGLNPSSPNYDFVKEDVFEFLRRSKESYDLMVLDPPAFAKSKGQVMRATRAYKDLNLWAMKRSRPGGLILTSSCSSFVEVDLFQKVLFAAAKDASREVRILEKRSHPADHPVSLYHPEGEYLKAFLLQVR